MALTYTKLTNRIALALGGSVSSKIDVADVINEAGRLLVHLHPWKFTERPPATLNFTAGQEYVSLPSDFGQLITVKYNADALNRFGIATFEEIASLRAESIMPPAAYLGAIVHPGQTSATTAPPTPRIELVPTPTASVTDALSVWYRARWTEVSGSGANDVPNIPDYVHSLYCEILAAVAMGYNERDAASMSARLAEIEAGPLFRNAVFYDGLTQGDYGYIGVGAIADRRWADPVPWNSVAAPA